MSKPTKVLEHKRRQRANTLFARSDEAVLRREPHGAHSDPDLRLMDCPLMPGLASLLRLATAAAPTGDLT